MDAVSRIVIERERSRPRLLPYALIALFFHSCIVGAIFLASRHAAARPAQMPSVSVKIVRPEPQKPRQRPAASDPRPTRPPPKATPIPEPEPEPVETVLAEPDPSERLPSEDAMAAPEQKAAPRPTPVPAPAGSGSRRSVGGDTGQHIPGIPTEFHCAY